jgi:hypothetical protein
LGTAKPIDKGKTPDIFGAKAPEIPGKQDELTFAGCYSQGRLSVNGIGLAQNACGRFEFPRFTDLK